MLALKIKTPTALKKSVDSISLMADEASLFYSPDSVCLQAECQLSGMVAILLINVSIVDYFRCTLVGCDRFNPGTLYDSLNIIDTDEWTVSIVSYHEDTTMISLVFLNPLVGLIDYAELPLSNRNLGKNIQRNGRHFEYQEVVGIPSAEFIRILTHFKFYGSTVTVHMTKKRVKFSAEDEKIVLNKKYDQCIIGGISMEEIIILIDLAQMALILNAAAQTRTVWILIAADPADHFMLNFPVGSLLGNLMFYFL